MEGLTKYSVLILTVVCLAAIPMAFAVRSLGRMLSKQMSDAAVAGSAGNILQGGTDEEISYYIVSKKMFHALRYSLAAGVLVLTWTAFGCLVAVLLVG
jgi:hypothetical protein